MTDRRLRSRYYLPLLAVVTASSVGAQSTLNGRVVNEIRGNPQVTRAVEQIPGVRIRPIPGTGVPSIINMRIENLQGCPMTVLLDRIRIQPLTGGGDEQVNSLVTPSSIAGIEVYPRSAGAPPEYQAHGGTCGIVLPWTK